MTSAQKTLRVVIQGHVQGVWFRYWTQENAEQLGLKGWARNRKDGSVEAVFAGQEDRVDEMLARCHQGPIAAKVNSVQAEAYPDLPPRPGFHKMPTL